MFCIPNPASKLALLALSTAITIGALPAIGAPVQFRPLALQDAVLVAEIPPGMVVESWSPTRVRYPADKLGPILSKQLADQLSLSEQEKRVGCDTPSVLFGNGEIEVKTRCKAEVRECKRVVGRNYCTAWVAIPVDIRIITALSVDNWIVSANRKYTSVSSPNVIANTLINWFNAKVYGPVDSGIDSTFNKYNGLNLKSNLEKSAGFTFGDNVVLNVSIDPSGVLLEAKAK